MLINTQVGWRWGWAGGGDKKRRGQLLFAYVTIYIFFTFVCKTYMSYQILSIYTHISSFHTQTTLPCWTGAHVAANPPNIPSSLVRSIRLLSGWQRWCWEPEEVMDRYVKPIWRTIKELDDWVAVRGEHTDTNTHTYKLTPGTFQTNRGSPYVESFQKSINGETYDILHFAGQMCFRRVNTECFCIVHVFIIFLDFGASHHGTHMRTYISN